VGIRKGHFAFGVGEGAFGVVTAAEAPVGGGYFGDEGLFEEACGGEFGVHGFAELGIEVALFGFDVVLAGVEAEGESIAGGFFTARRGAWSG
jgi:hypothetical protein